MTYTKEIALLREKAELAESILRKIDQIEKDIQYRTTDIEERKSDGASENDLDWLYETIDENKARIEALKDICKMIIK